MQHAAPNLYLLKPQSDWDLAPLLETLATAMQQTRCLSDDDTDPAAAAADLWAVLSASEVEAVFEAMGRSWERCCSHVSKISIGRRISEASVRAILERVEAGSFPSLGWLEVRIEEADVEAALGRAMQAQVQGRLETLVVTSKRKGTQIVSVILESMEHLLGLRTLRITTNSLASDQGQECLMSRLREATGLTALELRVGTSDAEAEALGSSLEELRELRELDLSESSFGSAGCVSIGQRLPRLTKLERLCLRGDIVGIDGGGSCFGEGLRRLRKLRLLDLDVHFTIEGTDTVIETLGTLTELETLKLSLASLGTPSAEGLAGAMAGLTRLEQLDLSRCHCTFQASLCLIMDSLRHAPGLLSLNLESMKLQTEAAKRLAAYLESSVSITELSISRCQITPEGMEAIGRQIGGLVDLETLNVSDNQRAFDFAFLAGGLHRLGRLRKLDISSLSKDAAKLIMPELHHLSSLTDLTASPNSDELVLSLSEQMWALTGLRALCLGFPRPTDAHPLISKLSLLQNLQSLGLIHNRLNAEGSRQLARQLPHLVRLRELSLHGVRIGSAGALQLCDACEKLGQLRLLVLNPDNRVDGATKVSLLRRCLGHGSLSHLDLTMGAHGIIGAPNYIFGEGSFVRRHPLIFAAGSGDVELVRELLATKANANELEESHGECALHYAARAGRDEAIRVLVQEGGASLGIRNMKGQSALDLTAVGSTTRALLEEMMYLGADEQPGEMIKSAARRFVKPACFSKRNKQETSNTKKSHFFLR